jgi:hypothetical protein
MRKRHQAGVIYVEVLIVVPLLIALFTGVLYVGRRYDARILDGQRARERTWSAALPGCPRAVAMHDLLAGVHRVQQKTDAQKQVACNERSVP